MCGVNAIVTAQQSRSVHRRVVSHWLGDVIFIKFDLSPTLDHLTDRHLNLHTWLRQGYLPPCKILCRSDKGLRFCVCVISCTVVNKFHSAVFCGVLQITYSQDAHTDFDTNFCIHNRKKVVKQQYLFHMSSQYGELRPTSGWHRFGSLGHPS